MKLNKLLGWLMNSLTFYNDDPDNGGGPVDGSSVVGTGNEDRLRLMDAINDRNDELRSDELQDVNDDGSTAPFTPAKASDTDTADDEPVVQDPEPKLQSESQELAAVTKIKVNGQEVELTPELIEKAQKIAAADKYLEEAALAKKASAAEKNSSVVTPARDAEAEKLEEERALVRAIQMGTEEEAIEALRKVRSTTTGITPSQVAAITDERLNFQNAINWFNSEYKDLVEDPVLYNMVLGKDDELVQSGDARPYKERYDTIGKEIRAWRDGMVKKYAPAPAAVDPMQQKLERKSAAPATPKAASVKSKTESSDEGNEESVQDVIAQMAKSRGGPQWTRA